MLTSLLIISISVILLVYWFRYSCILLLRGHADQSAPSTEKTFHFGSLPDQVENEPEMDALHLALQRDYRWITFLLRHAPNLELSTFEDRLLLWDYRAMQCWYRLTRTAAPEQARQALSEMSSVLAILGGKIGERAGVQEA